MEEAVSRTWLSKHGKNGQMERTKRSFLGLADKKLKIRKIRSACEEYITSTGGLSYGYSRPSHWCCLLIRHQNVFYGMFVIASDATMVAEPGASQLGLPLFN